MPIVRIGVPIVRIECEKREIGVKVVKKVLLVGTLVFLSVLIIGALLYPIVFAPRVNRNLQATLQRTLEQQFQREVIVDEVRLNFPNPQLTISNLKIARFQKVSEGALLAANSIIARISLKSLFARQIVIEKILIDAPTVWIEFDRQGRSNLPDFGRAEMSPEPKKPSRLQFGEFLKRLIFPQIELRDANIHFVHQQLPLRVDIERLSTSVSLMLEDMNAQGTLTLEGGEFDWQQRGPIATALSGSLAFKNNTLTLSNVDLQANSTHIALNGTLMNLAHPQLDLAINTSLALEELDQFLQLDQNLSGMAAFDGTVTGTISDITAAGRVTCSEGSAWKLDFANVSTDAVYRQTQVFLENLSVDILGGHAEGSGALAFLSAPAYEASLTVEQLDVAEANRFVDEIVLPLAGRMSGAIDVRSETFAFEDLVLQTALTLEEVDAYGVHVPEGDLRVGIRDKTLYIDDLHATVFQGMATGKLQMALASEPHYQIALNVKDAELGDVMTLIPQPPDVAGRVSGNITAHGATYMLNDVVLQADLAIRDMAAYGVKSPRVETQVRIQQSTLSIEKLATDIFDGTLNAQGHLVLAGNALPKFALQATLNDIASRSMLQQLAHQAADQPVLFEGRVSGEVNLTGNTFALEAMTGHVNLTGEGTATSQEGDVPFAMQVKSALQNRILDIEQLDVNSQALQLGMQGTLDLTSSDLQVRYDVASKDIETVLAQVLMFLPGLRENSPLARFSGTIEHLRGTVRGTASAPEVHADAHFTDADLVWARVDDVQATLLYDGASLHIEEVSARYKSAEIAVNNGRILFGQDGEIHLNVPASIKAGHIKDYLALVKQDFPIDGELNIINTTLQGSVTNLQADIALDVSNGTAWNQSFDHLEGTVALIGDRMRFENLVLRKNGGRIALDGFLGFDTSFEATLNVADLNFLALDAFKNVAVHYEGLADIDLQVKGTLRNPVGKASIRLKNLVYQKTPIEDVTCEVSMENQTIQARLVAFRQKFITTFQLTLNDTLDYRAELLMDEAAVEQILSLTTAIEGVTGVISGAITSEGSLKDVNAVSATVKLRRLNLDIFGQKVGNAGEIDLLITPERFTVNSLDIRGDELGLFAQGNLDFGGNFDLAVDGVVDLRPFAGFLPASAGISAITGHLQLICNVQGTVLQPKIEGIAEIHRGSLQLRAYPDPIKNIQGKIAFLPGYIKILQLQGDLGGGSFDTTGTIAYAGTEIQDFQIDVSGKQIAVNRTVEALTMTVSPHIRLSGNLAQQKLAGEVLVHNAVYSQALDIQSLVANKSRKISLSPAQQRSDLALDLFIRAPKDIQVRNRFAEIDMRADLRVQGTTANPQLEGRVEILRGNVRFGDITYRILSGVLEFADPLRLNPEMNIRVETTVQEYTVSLGISGTLNEFTLDMQSDPELSQAQITRLLAAGSNSGTNGYDFVTKPLQTLVEGEVGKALRLDRFSVDVDPLLSGREGAETSPRVTLGKRLFEDLLLTFTTTVGGSETSRQVEIEYRLSDRLSLKASRNEKGEIDANFTFKVKLDEK